MRFLKITLLISLISQLSGDERPPNIIFILVDDQGYYDLGCYGATAVKTPRIDQMAKEGIRFTDYYAAAPICSPSRAGLLKTKNYATACIGKWHLGFNKQFRSRHQGFDHYFGLFHNLDPVEVIQLEDQGGVPLI